MKKLLAILTLTVLVAAPLALAGDCQEKAKPISIGKAIQIHSEILGEDRLILVHLPPGYDLGEDRYPVLYLLDGKAHFAHACATADYLSYRGYAPPMIVVGIAHECRDCDMMPEKNADGFLQALQEELFPALEAKLRVQPFRILAGHSLGGRLAAHVLATRPEMFDALYMMCPSLAWSDENWAAFEDELAPQLADRLSSAEELPKFLMIAQAEQEKPIARKAAGRLIKLLKRHAPEDLIWAEWEIQGEDHSTAVPKCLFDSLRRTYEGWTPRHVFKTGSLDQLEAHYTGLSNRFGYDIPVPENMVNLLGYEFLSRKEPERAVEIFEYNRQLYPSSANVYDSLGEALEKSGDLKSARDSYQEAVERGEAAGDPNLKIYRKNLQRVMERLEK